LAEIVDEELSELVLLLLDPAASAAGLAKRVADVPVVACAAVIAWLKIPETAAAISPPALFFFVTFEPLALQIIAR
jgi:hypothetical protein